VTALVVDASVIAPFLIADEAGDRSEPLMEALLSGSAVAPQHWRLEIGNLGRKAVRHGRITPQELFEGIALFATLPVHIDSQTDELAWSRILDLSSEHDLTTYDAAYLELARRTGLPLASVDSALMRASESMSVSLFRL